MKSKVTKELQETLELKPNIEHVHFTADGHHHFRSFENGKSLYTRLREVRAKSPKGVDLNKFEHVPILDLKGNIDARFLITETVHRDEVLAATPINRPTGIGPSKADILATLEVSAEDLAAFLATRKKK